MQIMNAALPMAQTKRTEHVASPQLQQAAAQFESSFLQELLKPMTEDSLFGSSSEGGASGSMGTVSSLAAQALADGIAKSGGLGIAKRVLAELAPIETTPAKGTKLPGGAECGGCAPDLGSMAAIPDGAAAAVPPGLPEETSGMHLLRPATTANPVFPSNRGQSESGRHLLPVGRVLK